MNLLNELAEQARCTLSVIVAFNTGKDEKSSILVVGKQNGTKLNVINAIQGEDAKALWDLLIDKEEKKD